MRGLPGFSRSSRRRTANRSNRQGSATSSRGSVTGRPSSPMRGGQRMISPRSRRAHDGLGEMVDRDIFGEEAVEDRAEQKRARPLERLLLEQRRRFRGRARPRRPAAAAAGARSAARRRCARRGSCGRSRCRRGRRTGSASRAAPCAPSPPARSTRPRWLRLSMLTRRQATSPVEASSPLPAIAVSGGSRGRVGPATQRRSSSTSSRKRKSAPLSPTGRCSARWRLVHKRLDAQFGHAPHLVRDRSARRATGTRRCRRSRTPGRTSSPRPCAGAAGGGPCSRARSRLRAAAAEYSGSTGTFCGTPGMWAKTRVTRLVSKSSARLRSGMTGIRAGSSAPECGRASSRTD